MNVRGGYFLGFSLLLLLIKTFLVDVAAMEYEP